MCHLQDPQNLGSPGPMCSGVGTADRGSAPGPGRQVNAEEESPEVPQPPGGLGWRWPDPTAWPPSGPGGTALSARARHARRLSGDLGARRFLFAQEPRPHLSKAKSQENSSQIAQTAESERPGLLTLALSITKDSWALGEKSRTLHIPRDVLTNLGGASSSKDTPRS